MCPKPFSWAKNKRKLFCDGKSRGPLLGGAALNRDEFLDFWATKFWLKTSQTSEKPLNSDGNCI